MKISINYQVSETNQLLYGRHLKSSNSTKFQFFAAQQVGRPHDSYVLGRHSGGGVVLCYPSQVTCEILERAEVRRRKLLNHLEEEEEEEWEM